MDLMDILLTKVADGLAPVEHGRELEDDDISLLQQLVLYLQHVRGAVGYAVGACSLIITTGWVEEDDGGMTELVQLVDTIHIQRFHRVHKVHKAEIMR